MSMKTQKADLAVIGAGAAGLFAAGEAASRGLDCVLLEPNRQLGKKLRITGKGRCNLTNCCDVRTAMDNIPVNPRFLYSSLSRFNPADTMACFENLGVPLKVERGGRVFPQSDSAHDIADALERRCREQGVRLVNKRATALKVQEGRITGLTAGDLEISCKNVILCTGGMSYPATGSTGDGYGLAAALGHSIVAPRPSLVPLESGDSYCVQMQGFSLRNVTVSVYDETDKLIYKELGEMLFTHFGVSGPLVLSASSHMRDFKNHKYRLSIDLKPGLDEKKLDLRFLRDFEKNSNKEFKNSLNGLAGKAMIPVLIRLSEIPPELPVNSITKKQRTGLVRLFKNFPVDISGPRPITEAIVTSGGINVREVDPKTMESKLIPGLFFAGEVLDVDAYTGGFNLQIAWSTAYAAAQAVCAGRPEQKGSSI